MKFLVSIVMAFVIGDLFAQSSLVFYDAQNERLGELVQFDSLYPCDGLAGSDALHACEARIRTGVQVMPVDLVSGELSQKRIWYQTEDCTGNAFLKIDESGQRGGMIVYSRRGGDPIVGVVEWGAQINTTSLRSYWLENGQCADSFSSVDGIPISIVAPEDFGIKQLPDEVSPGVKALGYLPPIIPRVEQNDGIFCNGFETCPVE